MSLLTNPPHEVTVRPQSKTGGRYGDTWEPTGETIVHPCSVQPIASEESESLGLQAETTVRAIAKTWPWGPNTLVDFYGREWEQVGEARNYRMGHRTEHADVVLRAVGASG